jgi:TonB-dependent receptor
MSPADHEAFLRRKDMSPAVSFGRGFLVVVVLALLLLVPQVLSAQNPGSIKGRVLDRETGDPLPYANVVLVNTVIGAASDAEGRFHLRGVPAGMHTLRVSYIGYLTTNRDVAVEEGATVEVEFKLSPQAVAGEMVVVTGQAQSQNAAINQQLSSNTIANVVSASRIRELPDVNAAESIGRLPGVSIGRSGGEATKVDIRGLSAKYNTVTVNGVRVPSTGADDRSVDLSLISAAMLDGIELKKAVTPDMDADVLGGTVDLRLREAKDEPEFSLSGQGGYNKLQKYYGNYNFSGSASSRFFDGQLGLMASANVDEYDRSADKLAGSYKRGTDLLTGLPRIETQVVTPREEQVKRGRTGGSLLADYRLENGKITANAFFNRLHWDGLYRLNRMDKEHQSHYYDIEDRRGNTTIFTGAVGIDQDYGWLRFDAGVARTATRTRKPDERTWSFAQENSGFPGAPPEVSPIALSKYAAVDTNFTYFASGFIYDTELDENQTTTQVNIQLPYQLGSEISGYLKVGGKLRWLDRKNDEEQHGRDNLQYGNTTSVSSTLTALDRAIPEWGVADQVRAHGGFPITSFLTGYSRSGFMQDDYPLGMVANDAMLDRVTDALRPTTEWLRYAVGSEGRDYDGTERYQAAYLMGEAKYLDLITLIGGVRYENDYSLYHGQRYREITISSIQRDPADFAELESERKNHFWLPSAHVIVAPADWLKIRLARTETLTRPDYMQYAPITSENSFQSYIRAANTHLRPAHAVNLDASVSIYEKYVGLFTISGFHKKITDLIFQTSYDFAQNVPVPEGFNIPSHWLWTAANPVAPSADLYINNPYPAYYKGFELEWQTHFWYLPSVLQGLVLNVNYTRLFTKMDKQLYFTDKIRIGTFIPPRYRYDIREATLSTRMPDQPAHIVNATLGYDYEGFSTRLSYLFQTDKASFIQRYEELSDFSKEYSRWDLTVQQKLGDLFQVFANFSNLNGKPDERYRGYKQAYPTYIEYFGFTMDVGIRFKM